MKMKFGICVAFLVLVLGFGACGDSKDGDNKAESTQEEQKKSEKKEREDDLDEFLLENGKKVVDAVLEKAKNKSYVKMLSNNSILDSDFYKNLSAMEYKEPEKIYRIQFTDEFMNLFLNVVMEADDSIAIGELSDELQKEIRDRIAYMYQNLINQRMGVEAIAMASILSSGRTVIAEGYQGERGMLIFVYPDAYPLAVNYCGGSEEGILSMSGNVIFYDNFGFDTVEDVRNSLSKVVTEEAWFVAGAGLKIEQIK